MCYMKRDPVRAGRCAVFSSISRFSISLSPTPTTRRDYRVWIYYSLSGPARDKHKFRLTADRGAEDRYGSALFSVYPAEEGTVRL
jgi:hypothetical protein